MIDDSNGKMTGLPVGGALFFRGNMQTSDPCQLLEWDTDFFGFRIACVCAHRIDKIQLESILHWCAVHRIECLYFLADPNDYRTIRMAEAGKFLLVDVRVEMMRRFECNRPICLHQSDRFAGIVRAHEDRDVELLKDISRNSITQTRFLMDSGFPVNLSREMYATWIEQSCKDVLQRVFVAEEEEQPVGFVTCRVDSTVRQGIIGLMSVSSDRFGKGIGARLMAFALDWFTSQGVQMVKVVTQGTNIPAIRFYEKCGFATESLKLWYHWWSKNASNKDR
jgi:dTDP-4-amino-4,6-dideoxy-D-galactose acyltransferase